MSPISATGEGGRDQKKQKEAAYLLGGWREEKPTKTLRRKEMKRRTPREARARGACKKNWGKEHGRSRDREKSSTSQKRHRQKDKPT